jgi:uncharacterized protein
MKNRITLLDALRGLALGAIAIIHFVEQYLGAMAPKEHASYAQHWPVDRLLEALAFIFIRGKGFALFSFLFGVSFALQMQHAERRDPDHDFRPRFAWRLAVLLGIGFVHSLLYGGDILTIYALLGVPLLFFYHVPNRWLWAVALALILGGPRVIMQLALPAPTAEAAKAQEARDQAGAAQHYSAIKAGTVGEFVSSNVAYGIPGRLEFQFGIMSRGYQTLGLFLLGLWAGRRRLLEEVEENLRWFKRVFWWTLGPTAVVALIAFVGFLLSPAPGADSGTAPEQPNLRSWGMVLGLSLYDAWNFAMTLFYLSAFVLLYRKARFQKWLAKLAPYGRMALTNYLAQSVGGVLVFTTLGLGLLGDIGNAVTVTMGTLLFLGCAFASQLWLERFHYGPVEWLWRSLTFFAAQPFRRAAA